MTEPMRPQDPIGTPFQEPVITSSQEPVIPIDPEVQTNSNVRVEEFKLNGDDLVKKVRELIQQGNARRIVIKNEEGHTLIEIPLTVGVVGGTIGVALFPVVAAVGAIGAMVARLTLVVEKKEP